MWSFRMGTHFSWYQLKIDCYRYKLLYVSFMVTTKQKPIVNACIHIHTHTHRKERNISISLKTVIKLQRRSKRRRR